MHIICFHVDLFLLKIKSNVLDETSDDVVARLDAELVGQIGKVIQKGAQIDPFSTGLEDLVNELDKLQNVVGAVDEKAGDNAVVRVGVLGV